MNVTYEYGLLRNDRIVERKMSKSLALSEASRRNKIIPLDEMFELGGYHAIIIHSNNHVEVLK